MKFDHKRLDGRITCVEAVSGNHLQNISIDHSRILGVVHESRLTNLSKLGYPICRRESIIKLYKDLVPFDKYW